jgi:transcription-repair coupling factor (superfamily II helicase)
MYKRLAEVRSRDQVDEVRAELVDRYGPVPEAVDNLLAVAALRVRARDAGLTDVNAQGRFVRFLPVDVGDSLRVRIERLYPKSVIKPQLHSVLVPRPTEGRAAGQPLRDRAVLDWAAHVIDDMMVRKAPA